MKQHNEINPIDHGIPSEINNTQIQPISWNNFNGTPDNHSPYAAHIYWSINYKTKYHQKLKKTLVDVNVKIQSRSWSKTEKRNQHLLMHEYGHYLIGCLCALAFKYKINYLLRQPITFNVNQWIRTVFKETLDEYLKLQKLYDDQTQHRLNFTKQELWEKCLIDKLKEFNELFEGRKAGKGKKLPSLRKMVRGN